VGSSALRVVVAKSLVFLNGHAKLVAPEAAEFQPTVMLQETASFPGSVRKAG